MTSDCNISAAAPQKRGFWVIALVFLHLFIAPCATAMTLMPAEMDCEHCQTIDSPDACIVASTIAGSVIGGVAFDAGASRASPQPPTAQPFLLPPLELTAPLPGALPTTDRARLISTRHPGDPPLYLILSQLRI